MNTRFFLKRSIWRTLVLALAGLLLVVRIAVAQGGIPAIERWLFGAGGGSSQGGVVQLDGTFGQPVTGQSAGGAVALSAGFWTGGAATIQHSLYLPAVVR